MKTTRKQFDRLVQRAIRRIPSEFREHLDNILISVQRRPAAELLRDMGLPPDDPLLGIFQGIPLMERSSFEPPLYPDTIFLFQEPLEEMCATADELEREIEITVAHEIGHFLGISEERLEELGYG